MPTIRVSHDTREQLHNMKRGKQSLDQVIRQLIKLSRDVKVMDVKDFMERGYINVDNLFTNLAFAVGITAASLIFLHYIQ